MPTPKMVLATALAGLAGLALLFGIGHLLSTGVIDAAMFGQRGPAVVAKSHATKQGAPQQLAVHDVPVGLQVSPVATAAEAPTALPAGVAGGLPLDQIAGPVVALEGTAARPTEPPPPDTTVRLAFALGTEDVPGMQGTSSNTPVVGGTAQAFIESYIGEPVEARSVGAPVKRVELPKPKPVTKAPVQEVWVEPAGAPAATPVQEARAEPLEAPAPQAAHAPTNVVEYLRTPTRTSDWIRVFIKDFYLSDTTLDETAIHTIYSDYVEYFGVSNTSLEKVAREKADYYHHWPTRHYALVPGSIAIKWRTPEIADVSFTYDFKVSAPKKKTSSGRGRAHLTLDLRGSTGRIVREDGEVIAHN